MKDPEGYVSFMSLENKVLTEFLVELHHQYKNCRFTWSLTINKNWNINVSLATHAKITKLHKDITPRELYTIVCRAFFPEMKLESNTTNLTPNFSPLHEVDENGTDLYSPKDPTHVTFDYFFSPPNTFSYGRNEEIMHYMEKYKKNLSSLYDIQERNNQGRSPSSCDVNCNSSAPNQNSSNHHWQEDKVPLIQNAYALPKSNHDHLIIQFKAQYLHDVKYFIFILKSEDAMATDDMGATTATTSDTSVAEGNQTNDGTELQSTKYKTIFNINQPQSRNNKSTFTQNSSKIDSDGSSHQYFQLISAMESMNRRLQQLEGENAELKAMCQILKQQNLEMQVDMRAFQKSMILLTEKQFESNLFSYKEFLLIGNQFMRQGKIGQNIIHYAEALTLGTIRGLTPKKINVIYNQFKSLFPLDEESQSVEGSSKQKDNLTFNQTKLSRNALHQTQYKKVTKIKKELATLFATHKDHFVGDICLSWLHSTTLNDPEKGLQILNSILDKGGVYQDSQIYNLQKLSFASFSRGRLLADPTLALKDYSFCIKYNPIFFPAYINRGNLLHYSLNAPEKALSDYSVAANFDDSDYSVYYNRAMLFLNTLNDSNQALQDFNRAIKLNPDHIPSYTNRATLFKTKFNDPVRALKSYDDAILRHPDCFALYLNRGSLKFEAFRSPKEAMEDYNIALQLNPQYPEAYVDRAVILASMNQFEASLSDTQQALRLNPNLHSALELCSRLQSIHRK